MAAWSGQGDLGRRAARHLCAFGARERLLVHRAGNSVPSLTRGAQATSFRREVKGLSLLSGARRALVLAPHTDDEVGCAGSVARLVRSGIDVRYVAFSRCEESVPNGFPKDVLEVECRKAGAALGLRPEHVDVWGFRVRHFAAARQEILERLVALRNEIKPDLVFVPSTSDLHQDHATVSIESFRAFKHSTILGYELPQNTIDFETRAFIALSEEDLATKLRVMSCYESQTHRPYAAAEVIRGLALVRGAQANTSLAEAFEVIRLIVN